MSTQGERLAKVEEWAEGHEGRCEERLRDIKTVASNTQAAVEKLQGFVIGLILAVCGFSLLTLVGIVLRALKLGG